MAKKSYLDEMLAKHPYRVYLGEGWDNYTWVYAKTLQEAKKIAKKRHGTDKRVEEDTT